MPAYNPDDQAKRTAIRQDVEYWFTIEPVLTDDILTSRLAKNINAVKAKMVGNAKNQLATWISDDKPFDQITTNPKLVREPKVTNVSLLEDSTVVVELTTSTRQFPTDKPVEIRYALTMRYQIIPPPAEDVLGTNPYGLYYPFFTLQKTGA
nr:type IV secretion system protein [Burkholderia ubonensis]